MYFSGAMSMSAASRKNLHRKQEVKQFYEEARRWQSDIDYWKVELAFFKRLLDIYGLKITDSRDQMTVANLQQKLDFFMHDEIADYKREIANHEEFLKDLAENKLIIDDDVYDDKHKQNARLMESFKKEFYKLKHELYACTEKLKQ